MTHEPVTATDVHRYWTEREREHLRRLNKIRTAFHAEFMVPLTERVFALCIEKGLVEPPAEPGNSDEADDG